MSCKLLTLTILFGMIVLAKSRSYETGLIFYDLDTKNIILPPTLSVLRGRSLSNVKYSPKGSIWSTFGRPCTCRGLLCGCCTGLKVRKYSFDRKMCANFTYVPTKQLARLDVFLDGSNFARYGISADNPDPLCIPVMMPIPMAMCVQLSNIAIRDNNLNMCMDFVVRLDTADLMEMHFQCMRMGADGIQYVNKDGEPVFPQNGAKQNAEDYDDDDDENDDDDDDDDDDIINDNYEFAEDTNDDISDEQYVTYDVSNEGETNENKLGASNENVQQLMSNKEDPLNKRPTLNNYIHVFT